MRWDRPATLFRGLLSAAFQNVAGLQRPGIKGKNGPCAVLTCEALLSTFSSLQLSHTEVSGWDTRSLKLTVLEWGEMNRGRGDEWGLER
jgi:hypothetical protein